jgi:hypothetical protein
VSGGFQSGFEPCTGVSPYNGLANSTRPLPIARNQSVTVTSGVLSRAETACSADVYAPEYAPPPTEVALRTEPGADQRGSTSSVIRSPLQLRLHRALEEVGWAGITRRVQRSHQAESPVGHRSNSVHDERDDSFRLWALAVFDGRLEINCIEYPLSEDESLQFILTYHQTRRGWNDFVRIRLIQGS